MLRKIGERSVFGGGEKGMISQRFKVDWMSTYLWAPEGQILSYLLGGSSDS